MESPLRLVARFVLAGLHRCQPSQSRLFGKGKEPFWQQAYTNLVRWIIDLHRVLPEQWATLQQVYRCAIDPELFAAKIEETEKLSDDLNKGTVFVKEDVLEGQLINLAEWAEWVWKDAPGGKEQQSAYTRPMKAKLDELKIAYRIVWEPGPGDEVRERVEAVKRWFVHDWQTLDNKVKSSIVEGVSVFLAMFEGSSCLCRSREEPGRHVYSFGQRRNAQGRGAPTAAL